MGTKRYFGTDGIRGKVGQVPISCDWVLKLGWAFGKALADAPYKRVLIGKDTRISGYMFESALEAGLSAAGVDVQLLGPMPTPAIAYLTRTLRASAGIVISASHNSYEDNGIKFFSGNGQKISRETESIIEGLMDEDISTVPASQLGKAHRLQDGPGRYIEFCKRAYRAGSLQGLRVVLDCANGATYHIAPHVFSELGADVITIANNPDGLNINHNCGSTSPDTLVKEVLAYNADVGIAFDGDGDRVIMVDRNGVVLDGDSILFALAKNRELSRKGIVGTVMTNMGLEVSFKEQNISFERVNVGDRHVLERLIQNDWVLGGESSGHIILLDTNTTGDGIVSALKVLEVLSINEIDLSEITNGYNKYPQILKNVKASASILNHELIKDLILGVESELGNRGRILVRASGTEPVIRIMVEGEEQSLVQKSVDIVAEEISRLAIELEK